MELYLPILTTTQCRKAIYLFSYVLLVDIIKRCPVHLIFEKVRDVQQEREDAIFQQVFIKQINPTTGGGYRFCGCEGKNQRCSELRPHVDKSYFETYKSQDQMRKFGLLSRKLSKISRFQNLAKMRFCAPCSTNITYDPAFLLQNPFTLEKCGCLQKTRAQSVKI